MWNFFRPHALLASLAILLCLVACGDPPPPPKFKPGGIVFIGVEEVQGQVVELDPQGYPYKYVVRYLPPPQSACRDFRKDTFEQIELHPDKGETVPRQEQPNKTEPQQEQPK